MKNYELYSHLMLLFILMLIDSPQHLVVRIRLGCEDQRVDRFALEYVGSPISWYVCVFK